MSNEFRVNGYQRNWQESPDIATFDDGSFLIVWDSYFNNFDGTDLRTTYVAGQRYSADGSRIGNELIVDTVQDASSDIPSITALADGGYVVAWRYSDDGPIITVDTAVWAKVYNADGTLRRDAFRVDTLPERDAEDPSVVARGDGGFSIAYTGYSANNFEETYIRHYNSAGFAIGPDQVLSTNQRRFEETHPETVQLSNGGFVVMWNSEGGLPGQNPGLSSPSNALRASLFDANGTLVRGDFTLTENYGSVGGSFGSSLGRGYEVDALNNGGFVVTNRMFGSDLNLPEDVNGFQMTFYGAGGNRFGQTIIPWTTEEIIRDTSVAQLESGAIIVVWEQTPENGEIGEDVYGRLFTSTGAPITGAFEIGGESDANFFDQTQPTVEALAGGGFVVALTSESIDSDDEGISATVFGRGTGENDTQTVDATGYLAGFGGNDVLTGNGAANVLEGGAGNDRLFGLGGNDMLAGGAGRDFLGGGTGADQMYGGLGNDQYVIDNAGDRALGEIGFSKGGGIDTVLSFVNYTLPSNIELLRLQGTANLNGNGGFAPEVLVGNSGANRLNGGGGDDRINGKAGDDVLIGALGADTLVGDGGRDIFRFNSVNDSRAGADNRDFINGFQNGQDRINLFEIDANWNVGGNQAYRFIGDNAFTGSAGEVRFFTFNNGNFNIVEADNNGDGRADLQIFVNLTDTMNAGDFIL